MKLLIDNRENELINIIPDLLSKYKYNYDIVNLPLGDFVIMDDKDREILIIERKKLSDLASSIRDGRYNEQSYRLNGSNIHNHNIIYLIEGNMNTYNSKYSRINKDTLYSSMISLNYYKGFSVIRTNNIDETGNFIVKIFDKIYRETNKGKKPYYNNIQNENENEDILIDTSSNKLNINIINDTQEKQENNYSSVVKKVKKDNITPENIGEIILSQIPGISSVISLAIMKEFGSLYELLIKIKEDKNCLNNFSYETKKGQKRKISQKCISSIINYLLYQRNNELIIS
jgi:ERCC4-type nuclease